MKRAYTLLAVLAMMLIGRVALALPDGFYLPDSIQEMTLRYRSMQNLIVLPVKINDSITVNLILDTGCRNLVLFGKRFKKLMKLTSDRPVQFSGLGSGKAVVGNLSLFNKIAIHQVLGERIAVVVVPNKNLLAGQRDIDGVIGFELFLKFEIELNPSEQTIKFRPAQSANAPSNFQRVPLRLVDLRPVMDSYVNLEENASVNCELMIDTGSNLGLLLKTTEIEKFEGTIKREVIGYGFNGQVSGFRTSSKMVALDGMSLENVPTGIIESPWHNYASIGMDIMKDYVVVINYYKLYACFKKVSENG